MTDAELERGGLAIIVHSNIVEANKVMLEGVGPKLRRKIGATKHGTKSIADGLMRTLAWAILMKRGVRGSRLDAVTGSLKQINNIAATTKTTTIIKPNILHREMNHSHRINGCEKRLQSSGYTLSRYGKNETQSSMELIVP
jgi:hypothetical protein